MLDIVLEKARDLGRLLGQTPEYQALSRARARVGEDRELAQLLNRLGELEAELAGVLERGATPPEAVQVEYERAFSTLQANATYQGLVAAQANFEKVLARVNAEIARGIEAGAQSRIILPS